MIEKVNLITTFLRNLLCIYSLVSAISRLCLESVYGIAVIYCIIYNRVFSGSKEVAAGPSIFQIYNSLVQLLWTFNP
jgi:hypothetical protein